MLCPNRSGPIYGPPEPIMAVEVYRYSDGVRSSGEMLWVMYCRREGAYRRVIMGPRFAGHGPHHGPQCEPAQCE